MSHYWKNVKNLTVDEILEELDEIAQLEERKTIRGELAKRKSQLRARLKLLTK